MDSITVGVCYRSDSNGRAHSEYDIPAMKALNELGLLFTVYVKTLKNKNHGQDPIVEPSEADVQEDLNDVDLLFIPGATSALDIQTGLGLDADFNKTNPNPENENAKRKRLEYLSRSVYELKLIEIARRRGMIILAVCAGSWRLLEAYRGSVRTLPMVDRVNHYNPGQNCWMLTHGIRIQQETFLRGFIPTEMDIESILINSTHWAVAEIDPDNKLVTRQIDSDPEKNCPQVRDQLRVSATAVTSLESSHTPEVFESIFGAPVMGMQFHPESYLPGMLGRNNNIATEFSELIFINLAKAAFAYKCKKQVNLEVKLGFAISDFELEKMDCVISEDAILNGIDEQGKEKAPVNIQEMVRRQFDVKHGERISEIVQKFCDEKPDRFPPERKMVEHERKILDRGLGSLPRFNEFVKKRSPFPNESKIPDAMRLKLKFPGE